MDIKVPEVGEDEEDYTCQYCDDEITLEQIKEITSLNTDQEKRVIDSLVLLNKYRNNFKLDNCLRKVHFIAQILVETNIFKATTESGNFSIPRLKAIHGRYFKKQAIDDTILESLDEKLFEIFKVTDKDTKVIKKSSKEIKDLLKGLVVDTKKLYGKFESSDELVKTVKEKEIDEKGKEIEVVKCKIYITKHKAYAVQILSRAYAGRLGNGNELSRDGYFFRGKGLKQLTGRGNYKSFSEYRNANPFPGDDSGKIDFIKITDKENLECNSDLIASDLKYGVQSAIWYWNTQNGKAYRDADKDDVKMVSKRINGGYNGLEKRSKYTIKARVSLNAIKHYESIFEKGSKKQKDELIHNLRLIKEERTVEWQKKVLTIESDPEGLKLWDKYKAKPIKIEPKGLNE